MAVVSCVMPGRRALISKTTPGKASGYCKSSCLEFKEAPVFSPSILRIRGEQAESSSDRLCCFVAVSPSPQITAKVSPPRVAAFYWHTFVIRFFFFFFWLSLGRNAWRAILLKMSFGGKRVLPSCCVVWTRLRYGKGIQGKISLELLFVSLKYESQGTLQS